LEDINFKSEIPKITITASDLAFGGVEFFSSNAEKFEQKINPGTKANEFVLPTNEKYIYLFISSKANNHPIPDGYLAWIDNIYIVSAGSDIQVDLSNNKVAFRGKGSALLNIQAKIFSLGYQVNEEDLSLMNNKKYDLYLKTLDSKLDSTLTLQLKFIDDNKTSLGPKMANMLKANCYGYRYYSQLRSYDLELIKSQQFFDSVKRYYNSNNKLKVLVAFKGEELYDSPLYSSALLEAISISERIKGTSYEQRASTTNIENVFDVIKDNYKGLFRDKLIVQYMFKTKRNSNSIPALDSAISSVKSEKYKNLIISQKIRLNAGVPFFEFNLPDTTGKYHSLKEFGNSVLFMDFWFTGCTNCIVLNSAMKPVHEYFINEPRVKFISISIDKDKMTWKNSVKQQFYSHATSLNLFTSSEGSNSNLIKYYNITSYPTVFLIKNGKVYSNMPPRPFKTTEANEQPSKEALELIDLIKKSLDSK